MRKTWILLFGMSAVFFGGCAKSEDPQAFANEAQPVVETPKAVPVPPSTPPQTTNVVPPVTPAPVPQPPATRCAVTVYDRHGINIDQVWASYYDQQDAAFEALLNSTRLTYYPVCLEPEDEGEWIVDDILLDDTATGRKVYLKGLISNDPARFSMALFYLGKQLIPTTGNLLVGEDEAAIVESANYIYDVRCNLVEEECDPSAYPSKYPRR